MSRAQITIVVCPDALREARAQGLNVSRICSDALASASLQALAKRKREIEEREKELQERQQICMIELKSMPKVKKGETTNEQANFWAQATGLTSDEVRHILEGAY